ncbi:MAG: hypothetical protein A3F18_05705 [Legionellales bacterium RIFCSPHIGHO2_12_FULL_37_14]|nr:MAG: hypothetical protein A3F18_05705 [Legionellales bacterium RIFCSPHIGHO2_12_FULL_37_14]
MAEEMEHVEQVLSTYQWVTVGQLLETYGIKLPEAYVIELLNKKTSFFYLMLKVPAINVLCGIIVDQVKTYQIFIQKLFVEYLVSGADDVEESMGSETRKQIEAARKGMLILGGAFEELELDRETLILDSQRKLQAWMNNFIGSIKQTRLDLQVKINSVTQEEVKISLVDLYHLYVDADNFSVVEDAKTRFWKAINVESTSELEQILQTSIYKIKNTEEALNQILTSYHDKADQLRERLIQMRKKFYTAIEGVQALLNQVPGFKVDEVEDARNRSNLIFDTKLGE